MEEEGEQHILDIDIKEQFIKFERHGRILKMEVIYQDWPRPGRNIPRGTLLENLCNVSNAVTPPAKMVGTPSAAENAKCVVEIVKNALTA